MVAKTKSGRPLVDGDGNVAFLITFRVDGREYEWTKYHACRGDAIDVAKLLLSEEFPDAAGGSRATLVNVVRDCGVEEVA